MTTSLASAAPRPGVKELREAYESARDALLAWQTPEGCWNGELSPSALATATAVSAFCVVSRERFADFIRRGAAWLAAHQNADGGWGDTPESRSNLSTTMLAEAALLLSGREGSQPAAATALRESRAISRRQRRRVRRVARAGACKRSTARTGPSPRRS